MRNHFKLLSTSLIVALSFASSQPSYGMGRDEVEKDKFPRFLNLSKDLQKHIAAFATFNLGVENKSPGTLHLVSKGLYKTLNTENNEHSKKNIKNAWLAGQLVYLQQKYNITKPENIKSLKVFYCNGVLIYKPNPYNNNGKVELPIADLKNPRKTKFNLSKCDTTGLTIQTGCWDEDKVSTSKDVKWQISVMLRFEAENATPAVKTLLEGIYPEIWPKEAEVGFFFRNEGWEIQNRHHLFTCLSFDEASKLSLYEIYQKNGADQLCMGFGRNEYDEIKLRVTDSFFFDFSEKQ